MTNIRPGVFAHELGRHATDFTVCERHLTLLRNAVVGWQDIEFGAPEIDPKRPYGSSDPLTDIARLTDPDTWEVSDDEDRREYVREYAEDLANLHAETVIALQIVLVHGFHVGRYRRPNAWSPWEPDGDTRPQQLNISADRFVELVEYFYMKLGFAAPELVPEWLEQFRRQLLALADGDTPKRADRPELPISPERLAEIYTLNVDSCSGDAQYNSDVWALEKARTDLIKLVDWLTEVQA